MPRRRSSSSPRAPLQETAAQLPDTSEHRLGALRAAHDERVAMRDQLERYEAERARTPLALVVQVVSCRWAVEHFSDTSTFPTFSFPTVPCYQGKSQPDQDCRECAYVKLINYGQHLPHHERRYHDHGLVYPIPDEATADRIVSLMDEAKVAPLRRVDHEIAAIKREIAREQASEVARRKREIEQQQGARFPTE